MMNAFSVRLEEIVKQNFTARSAAAIDAPAAGTIVVDPDAPFCIEVAVTFTSSVEFAQLVGAGAVVEGSVAPPEPGVFVVVPSAPPLPVSSVLVPSELPPLEVGRLLLGAPPSLEELSSPFVLPPSLDVERVELVLPDPPEAEVCFFVGTVTPCGSAQAATPEISSKAKENVDRVVGIL